MNLMVIAFFLHNVIATLLLGAKFKARQDSVLKNFGLALLLNGVAFAIWSIAVILRPENLELPVTVGTLFFIGSLIAFLAAGIDKINKSDRLPILLTGSIVAILLFLMRTFMYPSQPGFSMEGLFFFNPHPLVQVVYIFALALTALPAIDALASKFKQPYSNLIRYGFIIQVVCGILLITSINTTVLYIAGWIIGLSYLVLWTTFLFSRKAWSGTK